MDYIEYIESKAEALAQHEPRYKEHSKYREFRQKVWVSPILRGRKKLK